MPWFQTSDTNPPIPDPLPRTARHAPASPRTSWLRVIQPPHPAFAHPLVPGRSQSQKTEEFPCGCAISWCRQPSSQGQRGARNPPWRGPESLGAQICSLIEGSRTLHTQPPYPPSGREGGPRGEGGSESPRRAEAGGAEGGRARWGPPRKPPRPARHRYSPPNAQPPGCPISWGASV